MTLLHEDYKSFKEISNCIYMFTSPSGKSYIGQTKSFFNRYISHKREASKDIKQHKKKFYDACIKYGFLNFSVTILAKDIDDIELLKFAEVLYIEKYKTNEIRYGYNMTAGGDGTSLVGKLNGMYGRKHTSESRQKMKDKCYKAFGTDNSWHKSNRTEDELKGRSLKAQESRKHNLSLLTDEERDELKLLKSEKTKASWRNIENNLLTNSLNALRYWEYKSEEELAEINMKKAHKGIDNGRAKIFALESPQGEEFTIYLDNGLKDFCNTYNLTFRALMRVKNGVVDRPTRHDNMMSDEKYKYNRLNTVGWKITTYRRKDYEVNL